MGLTILLCFLTAVFLFAIIALSVDYYDRTNHGQDTSLSAVFLIADIVLLVALVGIWFWRRWGIFLYGYVLIFNSVGTLFAGAFSYIAFSFVVSSFGIYALLIYLLRPKWELMN